MSDRINADSPCWKARLRAAFLAGAVMFLAALAPATGADGGAEVDAVTSASVDAETGASKQVEEVKVSDGFSVAYAVNYDGALFVMAKDLIDAYRRDELASDALFKGKAVLVKGEVDKTSKPDAAKPWVSLVDNETGKKVRCALKVGQLADRTPTAGTVVQVKGVCDGMKLSVSITEGEIVD